MAEYTQGDTRPVLDADSAAPFQGNGSLVLDSRRTRPFWFDGRFLAARDFSREQNYFLGREADLARSAGFSAIHGLLVGTVASNAGAVTIGSGYGVTPAGELVTVPNTLTLQVSSLTEDAASEPQVGSASQLAQDPAKRSGLFVLALKPVQFTANSITAYPTTVQGARSTHDADFVEATAVVLAPWPGASATGTPAAQHAALVRAFFTGGGPAQVSESLLPLALVSLQNGAVEWVDTYMVRRESAAGLPGLQFGLTDTALEQGFLLEYDSQLQAAVNTFARGNRPAKFASTDYFQALPPAGRFPLASIDPSAFTQTFFPAEMDVRLSVVPEDELAALLEESQSLPPIDLTADPATWANLSVSALVPVPRKGFAALAAALPAVQLTTVLPQVLARRRPAELLQFYRGVDGIRRPSGVDNNAWQAAFGSQTYGYYVRRRTAATPVVYKPLVALVLSGIDPASAVAGSPDTALTLTGSGFDAKTVAQWNGGNLATALVSETQLTATVPAALLANAGTATIQLTGPDQVSPAQTFVVTPKMSIGSLSPATAVAGSPALTLTVNGAAFLPSAVVMWNATALATTFVSATVLSAAVTPDLLAQAGAVTVTVTGSGQTTGGLGFRITPAPMALTSISPATVSINVPGLQISANGSGFAAGTQVTWNGNALPSNVVSNVLVQAQVPSSLLTVGTVSVGVAAPGQASPAPLTLIILPPAPQITTMSPLSAIAGGPQFTLTVTGTNFTAGAFIVWNDQQLPSTVNSATQMQATISAAMIASAGTALVGVGAPNQPLSLKQGFTVLAPLSITSVSPASVAAGSQVGLITVNGTGFTSGTTVAVQYMLPSGAPGSVMLGNQVVVSPSQITGVAPPTFFAQPGSVKLTATGPNNQTSNTVAITVTAASVTLTSVSPNTAPAGSLALSVTLTGSGFSTATVFAWNGTPLAATVQDAAHATVTVPANLVAQPGTASLTAANGPQASGALPFTVTQPVPIVITLVQPATLIAGSGATPLAISGTGFAPGMTVTWNGQALSANLVSATQFRVTIPAQLIASGQTAQIVVSGAAASSAPWPYVVTARLALSTLSPASAAVGAKDFSVTLAGSGFASGVAVSWTKVAPVPLNTTTALNVVSVSPQAVTVTVPAALVAAVGNATIHAQLGNQTSNDLPFAVNAVIHNPIPDPIPHPLPNPIPNPLPHPLPQVAEPGEEEPS